MTTSGTLWSRPTDRRAAPPRRPLPTPCPSRSRSYRKPRRARVHAGKGLSPTVGRLHVAQESADHVRRAAARANLVRRRVHVALARVAERAAGWKVERERNLSL